MGVAKINWLELDKESSGFLSSKERELGLKVWRGSAVASYGGEEDVERDGGLSSV